MIQKVELTNFQSHANTVVEFSPFVNAICGDSDHGKSGLLRGIIWAMTNKPTGLGNVSDWIRTEKGAIKANQRCAVKVSTSRGAITRERSSNFNGYVKDGDHEPLAAIRDTVPPDVQQFFNATELNIQQQHDPHFMVTMSPPEAARFLNKLVNLSVIDACVSKVEGKKRAADATVNRLTDELAALDTQIPQMDWVGTAESALDGLNGLDNRITHLNTTLPPVRMSLHKWNELNYLCAKARELLAAADAQVNQISGVQLQLGYTCRRINQTTSSLQEFTQSQKVVNGLGKTASTATDLASARILPTQRAIEAASIRVRSLSEGLAAFVPAQVIANQAPKIVEWSAKVKFIQELGAQYRAKSQTVASLMGELTKWNGCNPRETHAQAAVVATAEQRVAPLPRLVRVIAGCTASLAPNRGKLDNYRSLARMVQQHRQELAELQSNLPKTCPTCGQSWPHNH